MRADQPSPGAMVAGRYRLSEHCAAGLWTAQDTVRGGRVAVRWLPPVNPGDAAAVSRLHEQARAVAAFTAPGLALVHGLVADGDERLLVREWVEGQPLREWAQSADGPPGPALELVAGVARGLAALHRRGLVHGRVHARNVVVRPDGSPVLVDGVIRAPTRADPSDDTRALGRLLELVSPTAPVAQALAQEILQGRLVTPSAVAKKAMVTAAGLAPAVRAAQTAPPQTAPPRAAPPRAASHAQEPRAEAAAAPAVRPAAPSFTEPDEALSLSGLSGAGPVSALPPELDPRRPRPRSARWQAAASRRLPSDPDRRVGAVLAALVGLALLLLVVLGVVMLQISQGFLSSVSGPDAASETRTSAAPTDVRPSTSPSTSPSAQRPSASPTPSASAPVLLVPAQVTSLDPGGDGAENPGTVPAATDGDPATRWETDRYDTSLFGGLKTGVGLVADFGTPTTVTGATVLLAPAGSPVELRAGDDPANLRTVASAGGSPAQVALQLDQPVTARYWAIWLTSLPPQAGRGYRGGVAEFVLTGPAS